MKRNKKKPVVINKTINIKFKTKSGKTIAFKAIKTSLKPKSTKNVKSNRRKKS